MENQNELYLWKSGLSSKRKERMDIKGKIRLGHCRLCRRTEFKELFMKNGYAVAQCGECGAVFLDFATPEDFFSNYYSKGFFFSNYYSEEFLNDWGTRGAFNDHEKKSISLRKSCDKRVKLLRKYSRGGNLLDVGCAVGSFMERAKPFWEVYGVDVSEYAVQKSKKKGLTVFAGELQDSPYMNQQFDVVTLWDTIEHVAVPQDTLNQIGKITKPGGIVAMTTGDVKSFVAKISGKFWHLFNIPAHLTFFDKTTIATLLENSGFEIVEITYPPIHLTFDYMLFRFITSYNLKWLMPLYGGLKKGSILNIGMWMNLFDIMCVVARKKE